jgi:predicted ATPase/DNA-binding SARP family transcriptional activator
MSTDRGNQSLFLGLLGPPEVRWAGATLSIVRRQTRALLYRLAVTLSPVPRTQLSYLFWPDVPDTTARRNLTHLLTLLRRALPQPNLLLVDGETVAFHPQHVASDADIFAHLTSTADAQTRPAALTQALSLYRGPFLEGFALPDCPEFEAWLDLERSTWERRCDDALAGLVEIHTAARNYAAAITAARRALARDELAEDIHRRLIALYAAAGDRIAALRQFEQCAVVLERELGVAPLPETRTVYEAVRDGISPPPPAISSPLVATAHAPGLQDRPLSVGGIPIPPTPLIGRVAVLAELTALLNHADVRLLTLAGPGGVGKTRLALEVARSLADAFADGTTFVPLAPLRDPALVLGAIANALGLGERDDRPPLLRLQDALRERELLLLLDNFEHIAEAAADVAMLLAAAPRLKVLVSSRALLRIAGEHTYVVPPLDLLDPAHSATSEGLAEIGAVALFLARVRERVPGFRLNEANAAHIAAICGRLDGLPLAIELAAARAALLSPRMLLARLDRRLALLTEGPRDLPARQRTLRATIDWSYELLDVGEQLLLGRLAVFAEGWTLDATEQICSAIGSLSMSILDGLHALLDKQMVRHMAADDGEPRFTMLETIREYALERLTERGEVALTQAAHAAYFLALAQAAAPALHGPDQIDWFDRLDAEHANLRVALAWLLDTGDVWGALRLAVALYHFWFVRGHFGEGHAWLSRALEAVAQVQRDELAAPDPRHALIVAQARLAAAHFMLARGELIAARDQLAALIPDLRTRDAIRNGDIEVRRVLNQTLIRLLQAESMLSHRPEQAQIDEMTTLTHELNDQRSAGEHALNYGRGLLYGLGRLDLARPMLVQAEAIFRAMGDIWTMTMVMADLGMLALLTGDLREAQRQTAEARANAVSLRDRFLEAETTNNLGEIARLAGDDQAAEMHYTASLRLCRQLGSQVEVQRRVHNLAYLALHRGDRVLARSRFAESLAGFRAVGQARGQIEAFAGLAAVAASANTSQQARLAARLWGAADAHHGRHRTTAWPADQAERARYEPLAREILGDATYEPAYAAGTALTLDEAIAEALRV